VIVAVEYFASINRVLDINRRRKMTNIDSAV